MAKHATMTNLLRRAISEALATSESEQALGLRMKSSLTPRALIATAHLRTFTTFARRCFVKPVSACGPASAGDMCERYHTLADARPETHPRSTIGEGRDGRVQPSAAQWRT